MNNNNNSQSKESILDEEERIQLISMNEQDSQIAVNVEETSSTDRVEQRRKPRVYWIDWLRILASYIVVFQHTTFLNFPRSYGDHNWKALYFYNCFARHCVPLFIMISGLLFLSPKKVIPLNTLYSKYIYRIFISLVFWTFYYNIINEYIVNVHRIEFHLTLEEISRCLYRLVLGHNSGHLWYLYFCIGLYMATPLYKCITEKREIAWYIAGLCFSISQALPTIVSILSTYTGVSFTIINDLISRVNIEMVGSNSAYYLLGYLLNTHEIKNKIIINASYAMGIIGQILTIILRFDACNRNKKEVGHYSYSNDLNVVMIAIGTFMFFKYGLGDWINIIMDNSRVIKKFILTLSECSFGIYLAHMAVYDILLRFFNFKPITFDPMYWMPIYATILFFTTATVIYFLRLIPFFKKVT